MRDARDLVERLRKNDSKAQFTSAQEPPFSIQGEAADEIERLRKRCSEAEGLPTVTEFSMKDAPTIAESVMRVMRDHYWDSLEPQKELILKHIAGAMRQPSPKGVK